MTYPDHEIARELLAALRRTQARAEEALHEAYSLRESGFEPVQVRGLDALLWRRDGVLFTRERALSMIWTIEEDRHE